MSNRSGHHACDNSCLAAKNVLTNTKLRKYLKDEIDNIHHDKATCLIDHFMKSKVTACEEQSTLHIHTSQIYIQLE